MFNLSIHAIFILITCMSCYGITAIPQDSFDKNRRNLHVGKLHFQTAINKIQQNNIEEAIGYLRASHRASPRNIMYLTNLGVAEMNVGELHSSFRRFQKALRMDSSFQPAIDNFNVLKSILKEKNIDFDHWNYLDEDRVQKHTLKDLERIHVNELVTNENEIFDRSNHSFILEGAMKSWDSDSFSLEKLKSKYANYTVSYYPHNMKHRNVGQYFRTLSHALEELENPTEVYHDVDASEEGGYILFNLPKHIWDELMVFPLQSIFKTDDEWINKCFNNDELQTQFELLMHWRILIIGERNSGMFNHKDTLPSSSFHVQLSGTKRWHICPPTPANTPSMYEAGDVDWFRPNYVTHPLAVHAECYQADLKPGEIIFYPKHYWHQTLNLEKDTISITGTLVDKHNWQDMVDKLSDDCKEKNDDWKQICEHLPKCFSLWKERWS